MYLHFGTFGKYEILLLLWLDDGMFWCVSYSNTVTLLNWSGTAVEEMQADPGWNWSRWDEIKQEKKEKQEAGNRRNAGGLMKGERGLGEIWSTTDKKGFT